MMPTLRTNKGKVNYKFVDKFSANKEVDALSNLFCRLISVIMRCVHIYTVQLLPHLDEPRTQDVPYVQNRDSVSQNFGL